MTAATHRTPFDPSVWREFLAGGQPPPGCVRGVIGWPGETIADAVRINRTTDDVEVHVSTSSGMQLVCRLAAPGGVWRIPVLGDECHVLAEPEEWTTQGAPICLWRHHGVPSSLTATRAVLEVPEGGLHVGDGATRGAARLDDHTRNGSLSVVGAGNTLVITYTPPFGDPVVATISFAGLGGIVVTTEPDQELPLVGQIDTASELTSIE